MPIDARQTGPGATEVGSTVTDQRIHYDRLQDICGTASDEWVNAMVRDLVNVGGGGKDENSARTLREGLAFLNGLEPKNEVEAALGAQMFAVHKATMEAARRMAAAEMRDQYRDYGNLAVKLSRTYAAQVDAFTKLRSGGKQQVEVRYVYVDARGSQNIIASEVGGGGAQGQNQRQPHEPTPLAGLAFAPGAPVWGEDAGGLAMPAACPAREAALQTARWDEPGSADGDGQRQLQARQGDTRVDGGQAAGAGLGPACTGDAR